MAIAVRVFVIQCLGTQYSLKADILHVSMSNNGIMIIRVKLFTSILMDAIISFESFLAMVGNWFEKNILD